MLRLPDMPRSAFDLFVCARWRKALELGQVPPSAKRFRSACRIAYDGLPDKAEWEALAAQEDARFEREYQEAVERMSHATGSISKREHSESEEGPDDVSFLLDNHPRSASSRTLGTMFSELTLETVWGRPRPCRSLMESENASLSELAPFVAAVLRDKVVSDLMQETQSLKLEAKEHKEQKRHERIVRKAIFVVVAAASAAAGGEGRGSCEDGGPGGSDNPHQQPSQTAVGDSRIFCWATKYDAAGSDAERASALLEPEHKCRFRDLLSCRFFVHGDFAGSFASDASHFAVRVLCKRSGLSRGEGSGAAEENGWPDVVFLFSVGGHEYGFTTRCKTSTPDLLLLLGRPDFPAAGETALEQEVDLEFLRQNIKLDSRVRFQFVHQLRQARGRPAERVGPSTQAEEISL